MNTISKWTMALTLLSGATHAQQCTTLVYTGAPLTSISVSANYSLMLDSPITGTVVLAEPLPLNATNFSPVWPLFSFSIYNFTGPPSNFEDSWNSMQAAFTTVNGVITDWTVSAEGSQGPDTTDSSFNSSPSGDSVSVTSYFGSLEPPYSFIGSNTTRGTWACQPVDPLVATVATLKAQVADQAATIINMRAQIAAITAEASEYENLYRAVDAELLALEKKE